MNVFTLSKGLRFVAAVALLFGVVAQTARRVNAQTLTSSTQNEEQKSRKRMSTDAQGRRITVIDFDDANIEGRAKAPEGFVLQSRTSSSFRNIVELRRNFRPQVQSSAAIGTHLGSP